MSHRNSSQGTDREPPEIPDHEMLAIIGRGAFGEVWLARSLTGSMRAIKVIWREDFEHGGTYEREFDGILNYEPLSRQHPALVDILQVGRNDDRHYYYCIMELADHVPDPPAQPHGDEEPPNTPPDTAPTPPTQDNSSPESQGENEPTAHETHPGNPHDVDPQTYRPDILSHRIREMGAARNEEIVRHGAALARGIAFLHSHGLVHRDIKPGNVIFIEGKAKLADVGLVTSAGDGTFVGTEGFVPPEGPGTPAADIFSLGMVLYEMSTGKDRLDFPDLPSVLPEGPERIIWRRVNRAICRASARRPEARYQSGEHLALALEGQDVDGSKAIDIYRKVWFRTAAAVILLGTAVAVFRNFPTDVDPTPKAPDQTSPATATIEPSEDPLQTTRSTITPPQDVPAPSPVMEDPFPTLEIQTSPPGADVYHGEQWLGTSPVFIDPAPSNAASYNIRLEAHRTEQVEYLGASDDRGTILVQLTEWRFPQEGMRWENDLEMAFFPSGENHLSAQPISAQIMVDFARATGYPFVGRAVQAKDNRGGTRYLAAMTWTTARNFCEWLTTHDQESGILLPEQFYRPVTIDPDSDPGSADIPDEVFSTKVGGNYLGIYNVEIDKIRYGSVAFSSTPPGAIVYRDGNSIGTTPFELPRVRTGQVEFEIRMEGYKTAFHSVDVSDGRLYEVETTLEQGEGVDFESAWENSLGMLFLPSADGSLVSAFETRRQDFARFAENARTIGRSPATQNLETSPLHPVTHLTRSEAIAFCDWLTRLERRRGIISQRHLYRLPTDTEWSSFAGLPPERGRDPSSRSATLKGFYPWGFVWPPPAGSGNFAGSESLDLPGDDLPQTIPGFDDGYVGTAPVDVVTADPRGLYHIGGNVAEWVSDRFGGSDPNLATHGLVRGGSWRSGSQEELDASLRRPVATETRADDIGFRIILTLTE